MCVTVTICGRSFTLDASYAPFHDDKANFYLTFWFLTQLFNDDDSMLGSWGPWIFQIFRQLYIMGIIVVFMVSLGNRPQGMLRCVCCVIRIISWLALHVFNMTTDRLKVHLHYVRLAFCTHHDTNACIDGVGGVLPVLIVFFKDISCSSSSPLFSLTIYEAMTTALKPLGGTLATMTGWEKFSYAFQTSGSIQGMVIALASTYGIYVVSSVLYGTPWHLLTCFLQYLFLIPSFTNILMVYAFCNTHDSMRRGFVCVFARSPYPHTLAHTLSTTVSWGTKGDTKMVELGGAVKVGKDGKKDEVDVELPFEDLKDKETLNDDYDRWLTGLVQRPPAYVPRPDPRADMEDWYASG